MYIDPKKHKLDKKRRKLERARREAVRIAGERPVDHCPGCGYSLSGLTVEPCPECGMVQGDRAEIYAELEREHTTNLLGLRACAELWRYGVAPPLIAMAVVFSWATLGLAVLAVTMLVLSRIVSDRAQNPLDTLEEMNRFSPLRLRRRLWAACSIGLLVVLGLLSAMLVGAEFFR